MLKENKQIKRNLVEAKIEQDYTKLLTEFLSLIPNFDSFTVHHVYKKLNKGVKNVSKFTKVKGFTFLVVYLKDQAPYYTEILCHNDDNFSKLFGRSFVKEKAYNLLKEKGLEGLTQSKTVKTSSSNNIPLKIANEIITTVINSKGKKSETNEVFEQIKQLNVNDLEKQILNLYGNDAKIKTAHLRFKQNSKYLISTGKIKASDVDPKGGVTLVSLSIVNNDKTLTIHSFSKCSKEDVYNKQLGRKIALVNLIHNKHVKTVNDITSKMEKETKEFIQSILES